MLKIEDGIIEVLGPVSLTNTEGEVKYEYLRFVRANGEPIFIKDVRVATELDSYVVPGYSGRLVIFEEDKKMLNNFNKKESYILGIKTGTRSLYYHQTTGFRRSYKMIGVSLICLGIFLLLIPILGIPICVFFVIAGIQYLRIKFPTPDEINHALNTSPVPVSR